MKLEMRSEVARAVVWLCWGVTVACGPAPEGARAPELQTRADGLGVAGQGHAYIYLYSTTVEPSYAYNSSRGAVTFTHPTTGLYQVRFAGLGRAEGNVHVVAHGSTAERCRVNGWSPSGNDQLIDISCHQPGGAPADSSFAVSYENQFGNTSPASPQGAYVWTSSAGGTVGPAAYQWNDSGGTNTVSRSSLGHYTVTLPGMNFSNASVHVTAYGGSGAQHCKVINWGASTSATVNVGCFDAAGNAADSQFTLSYRRESMSNGHIGGHAWVSTPTSAPAAYQKQAPEFGCYAPGIASVTRPSTDYVVNFTQIYRSNESSVMITGYGDNSNYCKVVGWGSGNASNDANVYVRCFDKTGAPIPSQFNVTFTSQWYIGPC